MYNFTKVYFTILKILNEVFTPPFPITTLYLFGPDSNTTIYTVNPLLMDPVSNIIREMNP